MDGVADLDLTLSGVELVAGAVLADGLEALVVGVADSVDGAEVLDLTLSGIHSGVADLVAGAEDLVVGVAASVDGVAASVDGAEASAAGVADLVVGADGTLTSQDTGIHTCQFIMVV